MAGAGRRPCIQWRWHCTAAAGSAAAARPASSLTCSFSLVTSSFSTSSSVLPSFSAITASRGLAAPNGFCGRVAGWGGGGWSSPRLLQWAGPL